MKSDYTYDGDGNVSSLVTVTQTGEVLVDYNYAYDLNGNRLQKVSSKHKNFYSYDSMNRLVDSGYDGRKESFTYDKVGNRLTKTINDITEKYVYNVKNQLKELHNQSGATFFTHDKQGNTIKEEANSGNNLFEYNTLNQQVKAITKDGNTLASRYDTEGLRYEIEENQKLSRFLFHNDEVLIETDGDNKVVSRLTRGYDVVAADISDNRYYYSVDEQGSTEFINDSIGTVKNEYRYDAFGNILDSKEEVNNRITYTGQQFDGIIGQYYLRARYYNPVIGRFTQEDVYRGDGLNLYAYCGNNPVKYIDPSGYVHEGLPEPGDINFIGPIDCTGWKIIPNGAGAHLFERVNVIGRPNLKNFDLKETPRFYPYGVDKYGSGAAHQKLHQITKKYHIDLKKGGNVGVSDEELLAKYREAYYDEELSMIRGDLRTPNSDNIIAEDVTPGEAFESLEEWERKKRDNEQAKNKVSRCKLK